MFKKMDFESAQRLAHSVKGMAGNISAKNLFEAAYELDMSIRAREDKEWRLKFENFKNNLAEVINSITDYIDKNDIEKQSQKTIEFKPRVLDSKSAKPLMKQLLEELRSSSLNTEITFAQSEMVKSGTMVGPRIFSTGTILYGADGDFKAIIRLGTDK